jgi:hypothetical protein
VNKFEHAVRNYGQVHNLPGWKELN